MPGSNARREEEVITDEELAEYYRIPRELSYHAEIDDGQTLPIDNIDFAFRYRAIERALGLCPDDPIRALDVGAGSGLISINLARSHPLMEIVALDFNPVQMRTAAAFAARVGISARAHHAAADANALPLRGTFDLVLCTEVLEHLPRAAEVVQTFRALVRPGGKLVVTLPSVNVKNPGVYLYAGVDGTGVVVQEAPEAEHIRPGLRVMRYWHKLYTAAEATQLLEGAGFRVLSVHGINWRFPPTFPFVSYAIRRITRSASLDTRLNRLTRQRFAGNLVIVCG